MANNPSQPNKRREGWQTKRALLKFKVKGSLDWVPNNSKERVVEGGGSFSSNRYEILAERKEEDNNEWKVYALLPPAGREESKEGKEEYQEGE